MWFKEGRRAAVRLVARRLAYPLVHAITTALLVARKHALARQLPGARALEPTGRQRVLVVAAHPDDETIGCFGTILLHLRAGDEVKILIVTDGSGSRAGGLAPLEMAASRRAEVARLQSLLPSVEIEQLGLVEGQWDEDELAWRLRGAIEMFRPDIVYAPSGVDFHPEHIAVAKVVARTLEAMRASTRPVVRVYEMQVPLGIELTNLYAPLGAGFAQKQRAISAYRSQRGALDLWRRQARYLGALYGAAGGAEAFWETSIEGYRSVMEQTWWDWRTTPFRSLSGRPFGDFGAHTAGAQTRRALLKVATTRNGNLTTYVV
jgi:LmbE family N-acetylglucosaminyl deacetylase